MIASNDKVPPVLFDGPANLGLYSGYSEAHEHVLTGSTVAMFAPQDELHHVFGGGLNSLKQRDFRKRDKKPYVHREQIKAVYTLACGSELELFAFEASSSDDREKLWAIGDAARERLREAVNRDADG
ncbi:hypothetical protein [Neorhizobium sp. LjRoot104]|uniref:hypothetical protein n=1 Tax=Neorhizobium sp. LjRoot104 TaxID=3342254 RepID=UPI003ED14353